MPYPVAYSPRRMNVKEDDVVSPLFFGSPSYRVTTHIAADPPSDLSESTDSLDKDFGKLRWPGRSMLAAAVLILSTVVAVAVLVTKGASVWEQHHSVPSSSISTLDFSPTATVSSSSVSTVSSQKSEKIFASTASLSVHQADPSPPVKADNAVPFKDVIAITASPAAIHNPPTNTNASPNPTLNPTSMSSTTSPLTADILPELADATPCPTTISAAANTTISVSMSVTANTSSISSIPSTTFETRTTPLHPKTVTANATSTPCLNQTSLPSPASTLRRIARRDPRASPQAFPTAPSASNTESTHTAHPITNAAARSRPPIFFATPITMINAVIAEVHESIVGVLCFCQGLGLGFGDSCVSDGPRMGRQVLGFV